VPRPARARVQISVRRSGPATRPALARRPADHYIGRMCRRVIQSSAPLRYAIVDGISARHSTAADGCAAGCRARSCDWLRTFAIITTDANELVGEIHDRMPVILAPGDYARWLGEEDDPRNLMRPFPASLMRMWPISPRVNKPENDDAAIIGPIEAATDAA